MKHLRFVFLRPGFVLIALIAACSDSADTDPSPNPGPGPGPGPITGGTLTLTEATMWQIWGETITIKGEGFSTTKSENLVKFVNVTPTSCSLNYTSDGGDLQIVSASATQLEVRIPFAYNSFGDPSCGPSTVDIEVTVNGKKGTLTGIKFTGLPYIGKFRYHYGGFGDPNYHTLGDSVLLSAGILGLHQKASPWYEKLRLSVNGIIVPFKFRSILLEYGAAFILLPEIFSDMSCPMGTDGYANARKATFRFYFDGSDQEVNRELYIAKLRHPTFACTDCKTTVSKTNNETVVWEIKGSYMTFQAGIISPTNPAGCGSPQEFGIASSPETIKFSIPTAIQSVDCTYSIFLKDHCGENTPIGTVTIK